MSDLIVTQGADWAAQWPVIDTDGDPVDVTAWTIRAQVRKSPASAELLHEWTSDAGTAVGSPGQVTLLVSADVSYGWTWAQGEYDVFITSPGGVRTKLDGGIVEVDQAVTHDVPAG